MKKWLRRRAVWDVLFVALISIGGFEIGSRYDKAYRTAAQPDFGQPVYEASVMMACGRGFVNPAAPVPAIESFLALKTTVLSCDELPANIVLGPLNFTQSLYRYLMMAIAWQWKWSGVSWNGLAPLFGILFALTLCAAYGLFRLAGNPLLGLLGVVPLAVSAHHLDYLPQLRDYAKAPFILLLMLVIARLAMPPFERKRALLLSAVFGLVLGIGFGFRNDLLINVPPFAAGVLLLSPGRWRDNLRLKGACLAVASVIFVVSSWPILSAYRSGSNTGHVAVLGLTSTFDAPLGLTRPLYNLGPHYLDGYAATLINTHSRLRTGKFVNYLSPEYDAAAVSLIADVARHWPADILVRGLASTLQVLDFPFSIGQVTPGVPPGVTSPWLTAFYESQHDWLRFFSSAGPPLVALSIVLIGASSRRAGIALVFYLLYYAGYPAVQFSIRHFFHLEFVAWWALAFIVASMCAALWRLIRTRSLPAIYPRAWRDAAITAVVLFAVTVPSLAVLRAYQQRHVASLVEDYLRAPRAPLTLSRGAVANGYTPIAVDGLWNAHDAKDPVDVRYLAAEFSAAQCGARELPVMVKYEARTGPNDFSSVERIVISTAGPTLRLVPAYFVEGATRFTGFGIPPGYEGCLKTVSRIDDLSRLPVLVHLELEPGWQLQSLFQRVPKWETGPEPHDARVQTVPEDLVEPVSPEVTHVLMADVTAPGVAANSTTRTWFTKEPIDVPLPHAVFLKFPAETTDDSQVLRAEGVLRHGGIRIAVTSADQIVNSRLVSTPGPFTVIIGTPFPGPWGVRVEDGALPAWRQEPLSLIRRLVWLLRPSELSDDFEIHDVAWIRRLH